MQFLVLLVPGLKYIFYLDLGKVKNTLIPSENKLGFNDPSTLLQIKR